MRLVRALVIVWKHRQYYTGLCLIVVLSCACRDGVSAYGLPALTAAAEGKVATVNRIVLEAPDQIQPGMAFWVRAEALQPLDAPFLVVYYGDGRSSPLYRGLVPNPVRYLFSGPRFSSTGFSLAGQSPGLAFRWSQTWLLSVPPMAAAGQAELRLVSGLGTVLATTGLLITRRSYIQEDIRLDTRLTDIRATPDPLKEEQARRYQEVLSVVDTAALYFDGTWQRPVGSQRLTSWFGDQRTYLYSDGRKAYSMHAGLDFGVPTGTPVSASGRGRVVMAENRIVTGKTIVLEHLPGLYSIYMHLDAMRVETGSFVETGQLIGQSGSSGLSTGPHLHWEVRLYGLAVDPVSVAGCIDKF